MAAATTWAELATSFYFMIGGLGIFILLFVLLHFTEFFKRLLASRMYMDDPGAPPKPMNHAFAWVIPMLRTSEDDIIRFCGLDAAVYLRMFRFSIELFTVLTLLCAPILLPLNALASDIQPSSPGAANSTANTVVYVTASNIPPKSNYFFAHLVLLYVASGFVLFWTARTYKHIWALRHDYLAGRAMVLHPEEYTLLVTDIPEPPGRQESMVHLRLPRVHQQHSPRKRSSQGSGLQESEASGAEEGSRRSRPGSADGEEKVGGGWSMSISGPLRRLRRGSFLSSKQQGSESEARVGSEVEEEISELEQQGGGGEEWEREQLEKEDQRDMDAASANPPKLPGLEIPKAWVRTFFIVLRTLTMGFIQPPTEIDSTPGTAISEALHVNAFFSRLYPGAYLDNQGVASYRYVQKAYHHWRHAVTMLDRKRFRHMRKLEANAKRKHPRPENALVPRHRTGFMGIFGPKVESIPFWIERVQECSQKLKQEQQAAATRRRTGAAFVIFNSRRAAAVAMQTSHAIHGSEWSVHMAPQPQDVKWVNTEARLWERTVRQQVAFVIFLALVVFFYFPVSLTTAVTSIPKLEEWFPQLKDLDTSSFFYKVLVAVIPPLGLRICYWLAPDLLVLLSNMQGCPSNSSAQQLAAQRFYVLLLFNVFFAYLITDTIVNTVLVILKQPQYLVQELGASVPSNSGFFMTYIMTSTLVLGVELLRLPNQLIIYLIRLATVGREIADREKLWNQGGIVYHVFFPYQNLIITFGLVYVVMAPLVLPVVLFYSLVGYFVFKHQVMYVYSYPYQTGGLLWIPFVQNVLVALIIAQVLTILVFGLKQVFLIMALAVPLPIITYYIRTLINSMLENTFKVLPLELAVQVDEYNESTGVAAAATQIGREYMPMAMRPFVNPDLSPDAGPAENIHEMINPNFYTSQLQEAVEALSPRASVRRYASMGFMRPSTDSLSSLSHLPAPSLPSLGMPPSQKIHSLDPIRGRAVSMPTIRSQGQREGQIKGGMGQPRGGMGGAQSALRDGEGGGHGGSMGMLSRVDEERRGSSDLDDLSRRKEISVEFASSDRGGGSTGAPGVAGRDEPSGGERVLVAEGSGMPPSGEGNGMPASGEESGVTGRGGEGGDTFGGFGGGGDGAEVSGEEGAGDVFLPCRDEAELGSDGGGSQMGTEEEERDGAAASAHPSASGSSGTQGRGILGSTWRSPWGLGWARLNNILTRSGEIVERDTGGPLHHRVSNSSTGEHQLPSPAAATGRVSGDRLNAEGDLAPGSVQVHRVDEVGGQDGAEMRGQVRRDSEVESDSGILEGHSQGKGSQH